MSDTHAHTTADPLTARHADLLDGSYDCVDRIVLNGYCRLMMTGGGFRTWWRQLFGRDDNLTNNRLKQMAGDFARRLYHWGKEHDIPVLKASEQEDGRACELAREHCPEDPAFTGVTGSPVELVTSSPSANR